MKDMKTKFEEWTKSADKRPEAISLMANIKGDLINLKNLLDNVNSEWYGDDHVYRFYHQSFKVFHVQATTQKIVDALKKLSPFPGIDLDKRFMQIIDEGTGKVFKMEDNKNWLEVTRPLLEAFFHAKYFLEMAVKHGEELEFAPCMLPTGWAAVLYLYNLR